MNAQNPRNGTMASGGVAAMLAVVLVWVLGLYHIEVPSDVAAAIAGLLTAAGAFVVHRTGAEPEEEPAPPPATEKEPQS